MIYEVKKKFLVFSFLPYTMVSMAETKPIPVRIPVSILPKLDKAAARLGTKRATLIAFCATTFLNDFEIQGIALLPMNWKEILERLDGRRVFYNESRIKGGLIFNERPDSKKPSAQ